MTYQDYFKQADFEEIWSNLSSIYKEPEEAKPLYGKLLMEIVSLPVDEEHSGETIEMWVDTNNEFNIEGAPDPQEWLLGREVHISNLKKPYTTAEIAAHLLYWSTLYAIKTVRQHEAAFGAWFKRCASGPYYDLSGNMVKYIFLDFDGVLKTRQFQNDNPAYDEYGPLFDPKAVARLSEIVEKTKAKIVVISKWENVHDTQALKEMWQKRGLPGKIGILLSSHLSDDHRGKLIDAYIEDYINTPYVILDDANEFLPEQQEYFIDVNPATGISQTDVEKAVTILNALDDKPLNYFVDTEAEKEAERITDIEMKSSRRKRLRFWKNTILGDSAISWTFNLSVLRTKLEYNIGYWRYVQRHVGWEEDVRRMQLLCRLLDLASDDYPDMTGVYVNVRNAARYRISVRPGEFYELDLRDLRKEKAYRLIGRFMEHNMQEWWD